MSRNAFENTSPVDEEMQALARKVGGDLYTLLPELPEGERYELDVLDGRAVLIIKKD